METDFPFSHRELYERYLAELISAGFTERQAEAMLRIWWDMRGW
jgi:hypothetical protein